MAAGARHLDTMGRCRGCVGGPAIHTSTDGKRLRDSEVALIMEGAKSLKILKALRDRVPTYKPDDKVLELDDVPALVFDEAIPE